MNQAQNQHENRTPPDELEFTWTEIELASVIIDKTLVQYTCAVNDDGETEDHRWETYRERSLYPAHTLSRWEDPTHHDNALDALESANLYLSQSEQKTLASLLIIIGTLYSQAAITLLKP